MARLWPAYLMHFWPTWQARNQDFLFTEAGNRGIHVKIQKFSIPKSIPTFFTEANSIFTKACLTSLKIYRGSRLGCLNGSYGAESYSLISAFLPKYHCTSRFKRAMCISCRPHVDVHKGRGSG